MIKLIFEDFAIIEGKIIKEFTCKPIEKVPVCLFTAPSNYCFDTLSVIDNKISLNDSFDITDYGGVYEIRAKAQAPAPPPLAICQKNTIISGREYLLTIYKDTSIKFLLECENSHLPIMPCTDIHSAEIQEFNSAFLVTAKCKEGDYLCILSPKNMEMLFEDFGSEITFNQGKITVIKIIEDMCMRKKTSVYKLNADKVLLQSNMFTYANEHIYINELKPFLLVEAIIAEDYDYVKMLLTDEMCDMADSLKEYFGQIKTIDYPKYGKNNATLAIINTDNVARYYRFEFINGDISNIISVN